MTKEKKGKKFQDCEKMFGLKCLKIGYMLLFFNYAFFNCSYVYSLMYGMVHSEKKCSVFFNSPK